MGSATFGRLASLASPLKGGRSSQPKCVNEAGRKPAVSPTQLLLLLLSLSLSVVGVVAVVVVAVAVAVIIVIAATV